MRNQVCRCWKGKVITMKKRGWMMGLLSGLAAVGATAGVIHGQTGTAQSGFLSDVFQYGNIPDTQNVTSAPVTLTGNEWKGTDGNIDITSVGMTEVNSSTIKCRLLRESGDGILWCQGFCKGEVGKLPAA